MPGSDLDYVTIQVPDGHQFTGLTMASYASTDGTSFIGVQAGTQLTVGTGGPASELLGYTHFGTTPGNVGQNILPSICTGPGAMGCTPPLAAGPYTFWIQQANTVNVTYQFDFLVAALPPPPNNGDYNGDLTVDAADYTVYRNTLGMSVEQSSGADGNNNGMIDFGDYTFWKMHYGEVVGGAGAGLGALTTVPEPSSLVFMLTVLGLLPVRCVRQRRFAIR
jgi:hypothetical protein